MVESVLTLVEFKAHEKNLDLVVKYGSEVCRKYYGDSLRISQILTNLVGNAVKFTHAGEIGVYVHKVDQDRLRFEVRDTGIGLSSEQVGNLFQPFSQADSSTTRQYGGTGLGLSITMQLVKLMDGEIWVESSEGEGSSFIFEIELEEKCTHKHVPASFQDKRVLVVDDNETWLEVLDELLSSFGLQVDIAPSGGQALDMIRQETEPYDLILMDWNMPGLDGIETTRILNDQCLNDKPPLVVMVSASRQESIVEMGRDLGIQIFLQKPVNPSTLNDILSGIFLGEGQEDNLSQAQAESLTSSDLSVLRGSRILMAEDNLTNQEIVLGLLEKSGIVVDVANNGQEAIDLFTTNRDAYGLILMDLQMPLVDGFEAAAQIRQLDRQIPIVALTANAMKEDVQRTLKAGMNEHLNKPIEVEKLYATLLRYLSPEFAGNNGVAVPDGDISGGLLPRLETISVATGLKYLAGNEKLYLKVLNNFYGDFHGLDIANLAGEELFRTIHTIKGLSVNIGAEALHRLAFEWETSQDVSLLVKISAELKCITAELKNICIHVPEQTGKEEISAEMRDKLFNELKIAAGTKRPKNCQLVLEIMEVYALSEVDQKLFERIKGLIGKYKFKEALEILG